MDGNGGATGGACACVCFIVEGCFGSSVVKGECFDVYFLFLIERREFIRGLQGIYVIAYRVAGNSRLNDLCNVSDVEKMEFRRFGKE